MQAKKFSISEALINAIVGIIISILIIRFVLPLFGIFINWDQNIITTAIFFVASTARSYILRRIFTRVSFNKTEKQ